MLSCGVVFRLNGVFLDESFRRAIRKLTGKSLVRFGGRPARAQVLEFLSQAMDPAYSIVLKEHALEASTRTWDAVPGQEWVSQGAQAWALCQNEFPALHQEFRERFAEFRTKWAQRYTLEALTEMLRQGRWLTQAENVWSLNLKGGAQEVRNLYFETAHLLVGDAEKLLVMMNSRALHLQDRLASLWLQEIGEGPECKLLPSLEASLRDRENACFREMREGLETRAFKRFVQAFRTGSRVRPEVYTSENALVRQVGKVWNPMGVWDTGYRAYLEEIADYACGSCLLLCDWYYNKWSLFLRGFSRGQLDLFARGLAQSISGEK